MEQWRHRDARAPDLAVGLASKQLESQSQRSRHQHSQQQGLQQLRVQQQQVQVQLLVVLTLGVVLGLQPSWTLTVTQQQPLLLVPLLPTVGVLSMLQMQLKLKLRPWRLQLFESQQQ